MIEEMEYRRRDPEVQLGYARLALLEDSHDRAREHLERAKGMIEEMGAHGMDHEVTELDAALTQPATGA